MLDQTFDRIQKLVSQLELLEEKLSQEDVNQKLLRSLSPEWNTHVVVWGNKVDLDTMSMDDLYNNLKPNSPQLVHKDWQQIHPYDMEEMDLRWKMAMLTMRAKSLDEFVNKPIVKNCEAMSSEDKLKVVRKYDDAPSVEEWVLDDEEEDVYRLKIEKKTVRPSVVKIDFVKSKQQEKIARKTVKQVEQHRQNTQSRRAN
uniref:Ribonuclease H-like domain-containing protein n=1 Tax=Tanacetum cinerariifolium TaxID=118510 RepID=A0A6L2LKA4_TANCI|nr:ribonuclease H-like domain-containing protein [Tanacetum cinerariifolium]